MASTKRTQTKVKKNGQVVTVSSTIEREKAVAKTLELHLKGWTQYAIAAELGVSQPQVCNDLKLAKERLKNDLNHVRDELVAEKLAAIDQVMMEAWLAWERSKEKRKKTVSEESTIGESYGTRDREEVTEYVGDAQFLQIVRQCIADKRALLGLDAPTKVDMQGTLLTLDYAAMMKREEAIIDPVEDRLAVEESKAKGTKGGK